MVRARSLYLLLFTLISFCVSCNSDAISDYSQSPSVTSLFDNFDGAINVDKTDIIATSGNKILKIVGNELAMSYDLGATWKYLDNSIGVISYVHWFKDQTCLICGRAKAFWVDSSFSEFHESLVFDYDGNILDDNSPHFYKALRGHDDYMTIAGKEVLIWPDYFGEIDRYISRIWYSEDCGKTISCICKNKETRTEDGQLIKCRHFHDCVVREGFDELYITSGDVENQCMLIRGRYLDNKWQFDLIGQGPLFKFGSVYIDDSYLYLFCDYTGYGQNGILRTSISNVYNYANYEYTFTCFDNLPIVRSFNIGKYSFYTYDGSVEGMILFSYESKPFRKLPISFGGRVSSVSFLTNPNNDGLVLVRIGSGYNITDLKLNDCMYNFTNGMRSAGFSDFGIL